MTAMKREGLVVTWLLAFVTLLAVDTSLFRSVIASEDVLRQRSDGSIRRCDESRLRVSPDPQALSRISSAKTSVARKGKDGTIFVPVVFHICRSNDGRFGNVPEDSLLKALENTNEAFRGLEFKGSRTDTGFQFFLQGIVHWDNDDFYEQCNEFDLDIKRLTVHNQDAVLNVYTCWLSLLGFAYLPSAPVHMHGITVHASSFPPSTTHRGYVSLPLYNKGYTLVHELGHFLGLSHTFDGGCRLNSAGTAPEAFPYYGTCDPLNPDAVAPDTCSADTRRDPINNFMDYSQDDCLRVFTQHQAIRMRESMELYKPRLAGMTDPLWCFVRGNFGTAHKYALCIDQHPLFTATPDGKKPPITGWCRTRGYPSKWGDACCPGSCDLFPSDAVSEFPVNSTTEPGLRPRAIAVVDPVACTKQKRWGSATKFCSTRKLHLCSHEELVSGSLLAAIQANQKMKLVGFQRKHGCSFLQSKALWTSDGCSNARKSNRKRHASVFYPATATRKCALRSSEKHFVCCM